MSVFADTSALVKLYSNESSAGAVRAVPWFYVSRLARVEVPSALWRKARSGEASPADAATATAEFVADYRSGTRFAVVADTDAVLASAADLAAAQGLRAFDAVQLATAVAARGADLGCATFACFDRRLSRAAAATGFGALAPAP